MAAQGSTLDRSWRRLMLLRQQQIQFGYEVQTVCKALPIFRDSALSL
jgi:hypothetical protein